MSRCILTAKTDDEQMRPPAVNFLLNFAPFAVFAVTYFFFYWSYSLIVDIKKLKEVLNNKTSLPSGKMAPEDRIREIIISQISIFENLAKFYKIMWKLVIISYWCKDTSKT